MVRGSSPHRAAAGEAAHSRRGRGHGLNSESGGGAWPPRLLSLFGPQPWTRPAGLPLEPPTEQDANALDTRSRSCTMALYGEHRSTGGSGMADQQRDIPNFARQPQHALLFPLDAGGASARKLLDDLDVGNAHVDMWLAVGWLAYDPRAKNELTEAEEAELRFVSAVACSGLTHDAVCQMLSRLMRPYAYSVWDVVWDFREPTWRHIPSEVEAALLDRAPEVTDAYIQRLAQEGDKEALEELRDTIDGTLRPDA